MSPDPEGGDIIISITVNAKLICVLILAYADCWFSHDAAYLISYNLPSLIFPQHFPSETYRSEPPSANRQKNLSYL